MIEHVRSAKFQILFRREAKYAHMHSLINLHCHLEKHWNPCLPSVRPLKTGYTTQMCRQTSRLVSHVIRLICLTLGLKYEPEHDKNQQNGCAPSEDWSTWASAQSNQSLRCALDGQLRTQAFLMQTAKTLIRLGAQADPSLRWAHMPLFLYTDSYVFNMLDTDQLKTPS